MEVHPVRAVMVNHPKVKLNTRIVGVGDMCEARDGANGVAMYFPAKRHQYKPIKLPTARTL